MKVLSLFDGISCGMVALERANIPVEKYVAYEIEPNAIKISEKNYPQIEHKGDVTVADFTQYQGFDLLIGGSPCQGFSFAGKQLNFNDQRSKLFFEFVRALEEVKPKYFLLENVKMKQEYQDIISKHLGISPIEIDSALVSAQRRKRLYWTNIPNIKQPCDKSLLVKDVIDTSKERHIITIHYPFTIRETPNYAQYDQYLKGHGSQDQRYFYLNGKVNTITASSSSIPKIKIGDKVYKCDADDVEAFQTLPKHYTESISNSDRCKAIGNGWTVDVIAHILSYLPK